MAPLAASMLLFALVCAHVCAHGAVEKNLIRMADSDGERPAREHQRHRKRFVRMSIGADADVASEPYPTRHRSAALHPAHRRLLPALAELVKEYPFQEVRTQTGALVNIVLVRSHMNEYQYSLYEKYKKEILFLGISSFNDFPFLQESDHDKKDYFSMFPGFLHMMHEPDKHFPTEVKTLLMSQSDFVSMPGTPARNYSVPKKYDFIYSGSDCDVDIDGQGWCGWSKNWTFVKEALVVMCGEYSMTGVLVATRKGDKAYTIPKSCDGKVLQTTYLANHSEFLNYLDQSRFAFFPQVHDASPRVSAEALWRDVPILMNQDISGGWKYVNQKTGEFFNGITGFRQSLMTILKNSDIPGRYEPRKWIMENYGKDHAGKRLFDFVREHFSDRVALPDGTSRLMI